jgi:adenine-specific DNA-methyltransferase
VAYQHETLVIWAKRSKSFFRRELLQRDKPNAREILEKAAKLVSKIGKSELPDDLQEIRKLYKLPNGAIEGFRRLYTLTDSEEEFGRWIDGRPGITGGERMYRRIKKDHESNKYRVYRLVSMAWPNKKKAPDEYFEPLRHPNTKRLCPVPDRGWRYPPATMARLLKNEKIEFGKDETTQPQQIYYLDENMKENVPSVLRYAGSDDDMFARLKLSFEHAKPHEFAAQIISFLAGPDDIVLDSFAGSGTTAHALELLNSRLGSTRKYVLVQQPFDTNEDQEGKRNICRDVLRPRLLATLPDDAQKHRGFTYANLGPPLFNEYRHLGDKLPSYKEIAKYVFYTESSQECDLSKIDEGTGFIGSTIAAGGTSYYLLYSPNRKEDMELSLHTLAALLKEDKNRNWVIYCERIWLHGDQLRKFERDNNRRIRPMLVPFNLK